MSLELFLAAILLANLIVAAIFILQKHSQSVKMLITLLLGSTGVGLLLLLYGVSKESSILDAALMLVLLSSVTAIVFAKRLRYTKEQDLRSGDE